MLISSQNLCYYCKSSGVSQLPVDIKDFKEILHQGEYDFLHFLSLTYYNNFLNLTSRKRGSYLKIYYIFFNTHRFLKNNCQF